MTRYIQIPINILLRLLLPLLHGLLAYMLLLMYFGNLQSIFNNFFTEEVLFTGLVSLLISETLRLLWHFFPKSLPNRFVNNFWIYSIFASIASLALTLIVVTLYFWYYVGYSGFRQELIIFGFLYGISGAIYGLVMNGLYIEKQNFALQLQQQQNTEIKLQKKFNSYKNNLHPALLLLTLERVIQLAYSDTEAADELIEMLSDLYRENLNQTNTYTTVAAEIKQLTVGLKLLSELLECEFKLQTTLSADSNNTQVMAGKMQQIVFWVASHSILIKTETFRFTITATKTQLSLHFPLREKLHKGNDKSTLWSFLDDNNELKITAQADKASATNYTVHLPLLLAHEI